MIGCSNIQANSKSVGEYLSKMRNASEKKPCRALPNAPKSLRTMAISSSTPMNLITKFRCKEESPSQIGSTLLDEENPDLLSLTSPFNFTGLQAKFLVPTLNYSNCEEKQRGRRTKSRCMTELFIHSFHIACKGFQSHGGQRHHQHPMPALLLHHLQSPPVLALPSP